LEFALGYVTGNLFGAKGDCAETEIAPEPDFSNAVRDFFRKEEKVKCCKPLAVLCLFVLQLYLF
jgi:hypothetical protein